MRKARQEEQMGQSVTEISEEYYNGQEIFFNKPTRPSKRNLCTLNEITLDILNSSKEIYIDELTAVLRRNRGRIHRFLFTSLIVNDIRAVWKFKLNRVKGFLAIGLCAYEIVIGNNYKFIQSNRNSDNFVHGCFMISSNGYSWNSNFLYENNSKIEGLKMRSEDEFVVKYDSEKEELEFIQNDAYIYKLNGVTLGKQYLVPSVVFLEKDDSVTLELLKIE